MTEEEKQFLGGEFVGITDKQDHWEIRIKDANGVEHPIQVAKSKYRPLRGDFRE